MKLGLKQSRFGRFLFYRPGLTMVLYVDDAGIVVPERSSIDRFVQRIARSDL